MHGGRERASRWADASEGAGGRFLDGGFDCPALSCAGFSLLQRISVIPSSENPKANCRNCFRRFSTNRALPRRPATGPDHDRVFECTVHHAVELAEAPEEQELRKRAATAALRNCARSGSGRAAGRAGGSRILEILETHETDNRLRGKTSLRRSSRSVARLAALERRYEAVIRLAVSDALATSGGRGCAFIENLATSRSRKAASAQTVAA